MDYEAKEQWLHEHGTTIEVATGKDTNNILLRWNPLYHHSLILTGYGANYKDAYLDIYRNALYDLEKRCGL